MAVDKRTGRVRWKVDRPEAKSGHSTPIIWRGPDGKDQILLPGSFLLTVVRRRHRQEAVVGRRTVVRDEIDAGDRRRHDLRQRLRRAGQRSGQQGHVPPADEVWKTADADGNGVLSKAEFPKYTRGVLVRRRRSRRQRLARRKDEWAYYRAALDSENGMLAIRLGGSGDMTDKAIRWKYQRSVPQLPSPLLFSGVLYMVNDNGIITTLNPETGEVIKQGRLTGAPGAAFRVADRRRRPHLLHDRGRRRRRGRARRRPRRSSRQRPGRRHLRHAGVCRRPHLRPHDGGAVRVRPRAQ